MSATGVVIAAFPPTRKLFKAFFAMVLFLLSGQSMAFSKTKAGWSDDGVAAGQFKAAFEKLIQAANYKFSSIRLQKYSHYSHDGRESYRYETSLWLPGALKCFIAINGTKGEVTFEGSDTAYVCAGQRISTRGPVGDRDNQTERFRQMEWILKNIASPRFGLGENHTRTRDWSYYAYDLELRRSPITPGHTRPQIEKLQKVVVTRLESKWLILISPDNDSCVTITVKKDEPGNPLPEPTPPGLLNGTLPIEQGAPNRSLAAGTSRYTIANRTVFTLAVTVGGQQIQVSQGGSSSLILSAGTYTIQVSTSAPNIAPLSGTYIIAPGFDYMSTITIMAQ